MVVIQLPLMKLGVVKILWILYFLCVIPALVTLYHRAEFDNGFKSVALVVDYVQLMELAQTENVPLDDVLARVRDEAGIDHLALLEDTPIFLEQRGLCTIVEGVGWPGWKTPEERDEIERNRGREVEEASAPDLDFPLLMGLDHDKNHLIFQNRDDFLRISESAEQRYPGLVRSMDLGAEGGVVSLSGEAKIVLEWGMGFDPNLINHLKGMGFTLYPRLRDSPHFTHGIVEGILSDTFNYFGESVLIYDGDRILGSAAGLHSRYDEMMWQRRTPTDLDYMTIGWIEFAEQRHASALAANRPNQTVRVHSIENEEMEVITVSRAIDRFVRAVRERTVRVIYLKPFLLQTDSQNITEKTISMFTGVKNELENRGYEIGGPSTIRNHLSAHGITFFSAVIFLAFGIFLLIFTVGDEVLYKERGVRFLIFALLTVIFIGMNRVALGIALVSPLLSIQWLVQKYQVQFEKSDSKKINIPLMSILIWLGACAITLTGALLIAASSIDTRALLAIETFSGVKVALYLPILLAVLIGVKLILPDGKKSFKDGVAWILGVNIQIWHVILGVVGLVALFIMYDRSGNFPVIDVASWENDVRGWFETMLYARPRTKEMMVGHPGLVIGLILGLSSIKIRRAVMYAGVVIGSIALTSMTNTFCHFHTPIALTIWRTVGGLVIGGVIGIVVGSIILLLINLVSRAKKQN